jgi:quinoprotein glucose dehydrogenase
VTLIGVGNSGKGTSPFVKSDSDLRSSIDNLVFPAGLQAIGSGKTETAVESVASGRVAEAALPLFSKDPETGRRVLGDVLGDSAAPRLARIHAAQGLGQLLRGRDDAAAAAALVAACDDSVTDVRMVAARALGDCPADSPRRAAVQAALARRLGGDEPHVRVAAATSLGQLGRRTTDEPAIAAALVDLAGSPAAQDRTVRHAASVGLATATSSDQLDTLVTHESPQVRLVACVALRRLRDPRLTRFLDDANEQVAIEAARAIHDLPLPGAFAALAARAAAGPADDAFIRRAVSAAADKKAADTRSAASARSCARLHASATESTPVLNARSCDSSSSICRRSFRMCSVSWSRSAEKPAATTLSAALTHRWKSRSRRERSLPFQSMIMIAPRALRIPCWHA